MWNAKKTECWAQHRSNEIYILRAPHKAFDTSEPLDEVLCGHLNDTIPKAATSVSTLVARILAVSFGML
jgi:hypothetical protein